MTIRCRRFAIAVSFVLSVGSFAARADTQTTLPAAAGFPWSDFNVGGGYVTDYLKNNGMAGGTITTYTADVLDIDPDPNEKDPLVGGKEKIGTLTFQYVLYKEASGGKGTAVTGLGAALFGGFHLTDTDDVGKNFSFLQTTDDTGNAANATVDGGGFRGKVNGDIPGYKPDPAAAGAGWNFAGTEYDYFDNPVDPINSGKTVRFETALVCYSGTTAILLNDFTWAFTANGANNSSGTSPTTQATATDMLLKPYRKMFPDNVYKNIGEASCHAAVPEPSSMILLGLGGLGVVGIARGRRRLAA